LAEALKCGAVLPRNPTYQRNLHGSAKVQVLPLGS
jgi:hypothetical protein